MRLWFTADHHFGHDNIRKYANRPFSSVNEMDEFMIQVWNGLVKPHDVVWHLGDLSLGVYDFVKPVIARLNGQINILGTPDHHDKRWILMASEMKSVSGHPVQVFPPMVVLKFDEYGNDEFPKPVILSHYPFAQWDRQHYGSWHLHGHCHGTYQGRGCILDVGVDVHDFCPVSIEKVAEIMLQKGQSSEGQQ